MINSLRERMLAHENIFNFSLPQKLPVITVINGRSFRKTTSLLPKPFSSDLLETMGAVAIKLCQEIDGSIFAYSFSDEIVVISRNDQNVDTMAWYENNIQKITSASASIATLECSKFANNHGIQLFGDPVFLSKTFIVPNIVEAMNYIISKQQQSFNSALYFACFYELIKKYNPDVVQKTLKDKSPSERLEILSDTTNINFDAYPTPFKRGIACYRSQTVIPTALGGEVKNKLKIDTELPIFTQDKEFLYNIFKSGKDIIRI